MTNLFGSLLFLGSVAAFFLGLVRSGDIFSLRRSVFVPKPVQVHRPKYVRFTYGLVGRSTSFDQKVVCYGRRDHIIARCRQ